MPLLFGMWHMRRMYIPLWVRNENDFLLLKHTTTFIVSSQSILALNSSYESYACKNVAIIITLNTFVDTIFHPKGNIFQTMDIIVMQYL